MKKIPIFFASGVQRLTLNSTTGLDAFYVELPFFASGVSLLYPFFKHKRYASQSPTSIQYKITMLIHFFCKNIVFIFCTYRINTYICRN